MAASESTAQTAADRLTSHTFSAEQIAAFLVAVVVSVRYRFPPDIPVGFLVACVLLPITLVYLPRYRGAATIAALSVASALSGYLLTLTAPIGTDSSTALLTVYTWRACGIALMLSVLLWARSVLGTRVLVLAVSLGSFATLALTGVNAGNMWKFSLSVPVILLVLSLPSIYGRLWPQVAALIGLAAVSALNDSRSASATLLIAAGILATQAGAERGSRRRRAATVALQAAVIGVGGYFLVQAAILEGILGDAALARTQMQIEQSGSAIVGGRPEMAAAFALLTRRPIGYGSGTLAGSDEVSTGKTGMASIGYDPNNGYVENYMFGNGLEVHSLLGDFWISYGLVGAALALALIGFTLAGMFRSLAAGTATAVMVYLVLRLAWDFAFAPFASAMVTLPLTVAVALAVVPRPPDDRASQGLFAPSGSASAIVYPRR